MTAGINTKPPIGALRHTQWLKHAKDAEDIPIGATIRTPLGMLAIVEGYRGYRRGHRVWLVCRYCQPRNKAFDVVQVLPELVEVVRG